MEETTSDFNCNENNELYQTPRRSRVRENSCAVEIEEDLCSICLSPLIRKKKSLNMENEETDSKIATTKCQVRKDD